MTLATLIIAVAYAVASITASLKTWPWLSMFAAGLAGGNMVVYLAVGSYIAAAFWVVIAVAALLNVQLVARNARGRARSAALDAEIAELERRIGGTR